MLEREKMSSEREALKASSLGFSLGIVGSYWSALKCVCRGE